MNTKGLTQRDINGLVEIRQNNVKAIENAIDKKLVQALEACGLHAETLAKKTCPVDTGRLHNSITHELNEADKSVKIGTNVEYAIYVEQDETKHHNGSTGAHFLRNSIQGKESTYRKIIQQYFK